MRKVRYAMAAVIATSAVLAAGMPAASAAAARSSTANTSVPASFKDPLNRHSGQLLATATAVSGATSRTVPVSGYICGGKVGGGCWWETAIQFWYDMKHGRHVRTDLADVYNEYNGKFEDGWTDDNAWWGITWQLADQEYHVSKYHTLAEGLWKWDSTTGWDGKCGGSTLQHSGGTEDDISRAAFGVLASSLGKSGSASRAAAWIFKYMQGSKRNNPAAEGLKRGTCTAYGTAQLGGQTESWKIEQLAGGSGQPGTKARAKREHRFKGYHGIFMLLYRQYLG
jgi:hypothetical protein